jgi:hypothetical protein
MRFQGLAGQERAHGFQPVVEDAVLVLDVAPKVLWHIDGAAAERNV